MCRGAHPPDQQSRRYPQHKISHGYSRYKDELARVRPALVATTVRKVRTFFAASYSPQIIRDKEIKADNIILGSNDPQRTVIVWPGGE